jgi:two-component system sensor histidine kinase KdpD
LLQDQRELPVPCLEPRARRRRAKRGNLRLFFGGSAGLTSVRRMLDKAKAAQQTGVDVVVGLVNSGGCNAIDSLLCDFECLPALHGSIGAKRPVRIDVGAVRKRKPAILLVDTRALPTPETDRGARSIHNGESWTDIEDVIASGIDVWAALDATGFSSWATIAPGAPSRVSGLSML